MASSALHRFWSALAGAFKKPWQITGPTSSPEFVGAVPSALEYRVRAPATPGRDAIVPGSETDLVLNIVYYPRDRRRAPFSIVSKQVDPSGHMNADNRIPSPPICTLGRKVPLDDTPGDGYQK